MHSFFLCWGVLFIALILSLPITAFIYGLMGDGLELNGWIPEGITALAVSAGQACGPAIYYYLASQTSGVSGGYAIKVAAIVFALALEIGYVVTHLASWDSLEYLILSIVDAVLALIALGCLMKFA